VATALAAIGTRVGARARAWARRRQGIDPARTTLHTGRIYILPTRAGVIFGVILFTMLLGAMNYNNNLGFALTFLLAGVGIVSMHHCHHNLAGLRLQALGAQPVFAGETLRFRFQLENDSAQARWQLRLGWDGHDSVTTELPADGRRQLALALPTEQRGRLSAPRLQISTLYPLGLLKAWAWVNMELDAVVYPQPAPSATGRDRGETGQHEDGHGTSGEEDFSGLRDWRPGDPPRRIAWKVLARTGQTLVSEYLSGSPAALWIEWDSEPGGDPEQRIARLTRRVLNAQQSGRVFGLRLPGVEVPPASGQLHLSRCLEQLAMLKVGAQA
jgi:uncharacterized protein (DUF58 family)